MKEPNAYERSVWIEQVDRAFMKLLSKNIKIQGEPMKVLPEKPDEDFNEEDYPVITTTFLYDRFATERYNPEDVCVKINEGESTGIFEDSASPYDLYYQVDFWTTLKTDMNSILKQWHKLTMRWFNLPVKDESGEDRSCFVLTLDRVMSNNFVKNGKRFFHSFQTLRVSTEIDSGIARVEPVSLSVDLEVNTRQGES